MVVGFIIAISLIKRLSKNITPDPQYIINAALYSLIAGVIGARIFYVLHYFDQFRDNLTSVFAIWQGGLELLGGVILAVAVILLYLKYHKLPIRKYLDILAIALMAALTFGRIGCLFYGCCYGKPADVPWAIQFPYDSPPYQSQVEANPSRNRQEPHLQLPTEYFSYYNNQGSWYSSLKPFDDLTDNQQKQVQRGGIYSCKPVHPTQLYSSANALLSCFILFLFWKWAQKKDFASKRPFSCHRPGCTFALMLILYSIARFMIEFIRDDNPFEFGRITISQIISAALILVGLILMLIFAMLRQTSEPKPQTQN